ncbi:proteoglycan 4-like isoform X2 [Paramacrobiotus metropolitanus]|uniref:proteoglycan 4-like isoform X2 n=1 Tax=Paramacrobiotus metropolitanus TaxID=2943436 RepID=UPI002445C9CC|nr:proteoglycan 4-like isoform X2 [Paramacrobiotus metropolitanus]
MNGPRYPHKVTIVRPSLATSVSNDQNRRAPKETGSVSVVTSAAVTVERKKEKKKAIKTQAENQPLQVKKAPGRRPKSHKDDVPPAYEVEKILGKRVLNGECQYRILWKDYPESEASWEPVTNLQCDDILAEFEAEERKRRLQKRRFGGEVWEDVPAENPEPQAKRAKSNNESVSGASASSVDFDRKWDYLTSKLTDLVIQTPDRIDEFSKGVWSKFEKVAQTGENVALPGDNHYRNTAPKRVVKTVKNDLGDLFAVMEWEDGFQCQVSFPAATALYPTVFVPWMTGYVKTHYAGVARKIVEPLKIPEPTIENSVEPVSEAERLNPNASQWDRLQLLQKGVIETQSKSPVKEAVQTEEFLAVEDARVTMPETVSEPLATTSESSSSSSARTPMVQTNFVMRLPSVPSGRSIQEPRLAVPLEKDHLNADLIRRAHPSPSRSTVTASEESVTTPVQAPRSSGSRSPPKSPQHRHSPPKSPRHGHDSSAAKNSQATIRTLLGGREKIPVVLMPQVGSAAYIMKAKKLSLYIPLLKYVVKKMESLPGRQDQLRRSKLLLDVALGTSPPSSYALLEKCDDILMRSRNWLLREAGERAVAVIKEVDSHFGSDTGSPPSAQRPASTMTESGPFASQESSAGSAIEARRSATEEPGPSVERTPPALKKAQPLAPTSLPVAPVHTPQAFSAIMQQTPNRVMTMRPTSMRPPVRSPSGPATVNPAPPRYAFLPYTPGDTRIGAVRSVSMPRSFAEKIFQARQMVANQRSGGQISTAAPVNQMGQAPAVPIQPGTSAAAVAASAGCSNSVSVRTPQGQNVGNRTHGMLQPRANGSGTPPAVRPRAPLSPRMPTIPPSFGALSVQEWTTLANSGYVLRSQNQTNLPPGAPGPVSTAAPRNNIPPPGTPQASGSNVRNAPAVRQIPLRAPGAPNLPNLTPMLTRLCGPSSITNPPSHLPRLKSPFCRYREQMMQGMIGTPSAEASAIIEKRLNLQWSRMTPEQRQPYVNAYEMEKKARQTQSPGKNRNTPGPSGPGKPTQ